MANKLKAATTTFKLVGYADENVNRHLRGFIEVHCCNFGVLVVPTANLVVRKNPNGMAILVWEGNVRDVYETYESVIQKMKDAQ